MMGERRFEPFTPDELIILHSGLTYHGRRSPVQVNMLIEVRTEIAVRLANPAGHRSRAAERGTHGTEPSDYRA